MMYGLHYFESYSNYYEVEANSPDEAKEKLIDMIHNGEAEGPDECYDSGFSGEPEELI